MTAEIYRKDEFLAGKIEGKIEGQVHSIISFLSDIDIAPVPDHLTERISSVTDEEILDSLLKKAAKAESISEFEEILDEMNL